MTTVQMYLWEGGGDNRRWPAWLRLRKPQFIPDEGRLYVGGLCARRGDILVLDGERLAVFREA